MRNPIVRAVCRLAATAAAAFAFYRYSWMPEHANHVLKTVQTRTQTALETPGDRANFAARDNIAFLQTDHQRLPALRRLPPHLRRQRPHPRPQRRRDRALHRRAGGRPSSRNLFRPRRHLSRRGEARCRPRRTSPWPRVSIRCISTSVDAGMQERVAAVNKAVPYNPPPR